MPVEISVIITVYNRKKYLKEAVNSVLNSTLNRTFYEIIVVKNFLDNEIDTYLNMNGVIIINTQDVNIGRQIAYGLSRASGNVISFLDDDDQFETNKLSVILSEFKDQTLIYYHNLNTPISENSTPMQGMINPPIKSELILYPDTTENLMISLSQRKDMTHYTIMFNLSCVSLRKEVLLKRKAYLERIIDGTDHFVFYISLLENKKMKFDTKYLTIYRVHESASNLLSGEFEPKRIGIQSIKLFLEPGHYARILDEMTRGSKVNSLIKCKLLEETLLIDILSFEMKTHYSIRNFFQYMNCLKINYRPSLKNSMVRFIFVTLALIFPKMTGIGYMMYKHSRYRKKLHLNYLN